MSAETNSADNTNLSFGVPNEIYESLAPNHQENHIRAYNFAWLAQAELGMAIDSAIDLDEHLEEKDVNPEVTRELKIHFLEDLKDFETYKDAAKLLMPPRVAYKPITTPRKVLSPEDPTKESVITKAEFIDNPNGTVGKIVSWSAIHRIIRNEEGFPLRVDPDNPDNIVGDIGQALRWLAAHKKGFESTNYGQVLLDIHNQQPKQR